MPAGGILDRQARLARSGQARRRGRAARCRLPTQRLAMTCVVDHEAVSDPVVQVSRDSPPPPVHEALAPRQCVILPPACLAAGGKGVSRISGRASESHVFARRTSTHRLPTNLVPGPGQASPGTRKTHGQCCVRGTCCCTAALASWHCSALFCSARRTLHCASAAPLASSPASSVLPQGCAQAGISSAHPHGRVSRVVWQFLMIKTNNKTSPSGCCF